jgi:hypothetical protein
MPHELTIYVLAVVVGLLAGVGIPRPPLRREKSERRL